MPAFHQGSVVGAHLTDDDDMPWAMGGASAAEAEIELSEPEAHRLARERRKALKRRRPCGFAPWPEPDERGEGGHSS